MQDSAGGREGVGAQGAATRAAIAEAARKMFTENGFAGTSVRGIAGAVGVDAALVIRYFGSKERLFLETVRMSGFLDRALDGPDDGLGERIVAAVFAGDLEARLSVFGALMRASGSDSIRQNLRESGDTTFIQPLVRRLPGPDARLRAELIGAQVSGLLTVLAQGDAELADEAGRDTLIRTYGRAVQALIDP